VPGVPGGRPATGKLRGLTRRGRRAEHAAPPSDPVQHHANYCYFLLLLRTVKPVVPAVVVPVVVVPAVTATAPVAAAAAAAVTAAADLRQLRGRKRLKLLPRRDQLLRLA